MGGPPRLMNPISLQRARFKRRLSESEKEEEKGEEAPGQVNTAEDNIKVRKLRRKKRRLFFASQTSDADATSAGSDSEAVSEANFSEAGYLTDASDLSMVEERMPGSGDPAKVYRKETIEIPYFEFAPPRLCVTNLVALFALAVTCRPNNMVTLSDLCRLLNSEQLTWKSLPSLLPSSLQTTSQDVALLTFQPRRIVLNTSRLGRLTHRMASYLSTSKASPTSSLTLPVLPSTSMAEQLLKRVLSDLCLPSELAPELMMVFSPLLATNQWFNVPPYSTNTKPSLPWNAAASNASAKKFVRSCHMATFTNLTLRTESSEWKLKAVPSATTRILALIVISLKYLCGLDDQTEVELLLMKNWKLNRHF